jgi:hypothetical protein
MNDFFMLTAFAGLAAAVLAPRQKPRTGRIVFWTGAVVACLSVFLMAYPHDWQSGIAMSLFVACATVVVAYVNTEFISIRGKTYSLFADPDQIDDYGGGLTAKKAWWIATLGVGILILIGIAYFANGHRAWVPAAAGTIIVLAAFSFAYRDALTAQPVAAGQRVQFGLLSLMTVGVFGVAYLGAYHASKRWLMKRQAYGRHQRKIR